MGDGRLGIACSPFNQLNVAGNPSKYHYQRAVSSFLELCVLSSVSVYYTEGPQSGAES